MVRLRLVDSNHACNAPLGLRTRGTPSASDVLSGSCTVNSILKLAMEGSKTIPHEIYQIYLSRGI